MKTQVMSNGQVMIPPEIWQQLGLHEGDELLLSLEGNEVRLRPAKKRRLSEFRGVLPATVPYPGKEVIRQQVSETHAANRIHPSL
jgi:antitoxin PrlF